MTTYSGIHFPRNLCYRNQQSLLNMFTEVNYLKTHLNALHHGTRKVLKARVQVKHVSDFINTL